MSSEHGRFDWRARVGQAYLLVVTAFLVAVGADAFSASRDLADPVRCDGQEMTRGDVCLVVDLGRSSDVEDLVRRGEPPRELRVRHENGKVTVGSPMSYDRMRNKRTGDGRAAMVMAMLAFATATVVAMILLVSFRPVAHLVRRVHASTQAALRARPRSRATRILWGRGDDVHRDGSHPDEPHDPMSPRP